MTIERIKEALEQAKGGLEWYNKNHPKMKEQIKWQETIIWALEKQAPKKVSSKINKFKIEQEYCHNCGQFFQTEPKYCYNCGQRLDWSEEK